MQHFAVGMLSSAFSLEIIENSNSAILFKSLSLILFFLTYSRLGDKGMAIKKGRVAASCMRQGICYADDDLLEMPPEGSNLSEKKFPSEFIRTFCDLTNRHFYGYYSW